MPARCRGAERSADPRTDPDNAPPPRASPDVSANARAVRLSVIIMQPADDDLREQTRAMVRDLLRQYDERVAERGHFPDFSAGRAVQFGDPAVSLPGRVDLVLMAMDPAIDARFATQRFISVRVMKSRDGGFASLSCLHGTRDELRRALREQAEDPDFLVARIGELADGLPEETDPDIWR